MTALEELSFYIRPPGQGIHMVSTGKKSRDEFLRSYLGETPDNWIDQLKKLETEKVAILGIPSDCGAGIVRGCAHGPMEIRRALKKPPAFDMGDVFCVPHFLSDEMLSGDQILKTQKAIHSGKKLPVSPLSICKRVYELCHQINPELKILLLGGDHSVSWPAVDVIMDHQNLDDFAIVHFDAHTDLLESRLGVDICFGTWTHHANQKIGRRQKIIQLGIRASGKPKEFWEKEHQVRQIWGDEAQNMSPQQLAELTVEHLDNIGAKSIYITNDIDGTDAKWAAACGTPEPGGLSPDQVCAVIAAMKKYNVVGADLVEVAPGLSLDKKLSASTLETSVKYIHKTLSVLC